MTIFCVPDFVSVLKFFRHFFFFFFLLETFSLWKITKQFLLWWVLLFWFGNPIQISSMPPGHWKVCLKHWFSLYQYLKTFLSRKRIKPLQCVLRVGKFIWIVLYLFEYAPLVLRIYQTFQLRDIFPSIDRKQ